MDQNLQTAATVSSLGMDKPQTEGRSGDGEKKVGPIIASLIVVLVLIITALYLFASRINQPIIPDDDATAEQADAVKPVTDTSTDVTSLQSDLDVSTQGLDSQNF